MVLVTGATDHVRRAAVCGLASLGAERDNRLVGLDQPAEVRARGDHGSAKPGAQHPGGAVRAEAELVLQLQRRDPVGMAIKNAAQNQIVSG